MKKVHIKTTLAQRTTLEMLRKEFAGAGYYIFDVAKWYRRHSLDFVAVPKQNGPQVFVLFRPMRRGLISARPFASASIYGKAQRLLAELAPKLESRVQWSNRQLPYAYLRQDWWYSYLTDEGFEEYRRLM